MKNLEMAPNGDSFRIQKESRFSFFEKTIAGAIGLISPRAGFQWLKAHKALKEFAYEGGDYANNYRAHGGFYQNASPESSNIQLERIQMIWDCRDLSDNSGIVDGIYRMYQDYVLGNLDDIRLNTGNPDDDERIASRWKTWCGICDATGMFNFDEFARLAQRCYLRDGDSFVRTKPLEKDFFGVKQEVMTLQLIEADCIGSPYQIVTTKSYIGGININPDTGERISADYYYRDPASASYNKTAEIPFEELIQIYKPRRAGQYRGIPLVAPALPAFRDLKEILENERIAVKMLSSYSLFIQTGTGDIQDDETVYQSNIPDAGTGNTERLKNFQPGQVVYGNQGEEPKFLNSDRPSPAFQGLVKTLFREAFIACGIDYGFAYDGESVQGTYARLSSAKTKRTFDREWIFFFKSFLRPIFIRWYLHEQESGRMDDISAETKKKMSWMNVRWVRPAHPTADVGRESAADMAEFEKKIKSAGTILEEQGLDWSDERNKIEKEESERIGGEVTSISNLSERIGERGTVAAVQFISAYGGGQIDRATAIGSSMTLFGLTQDQADKMFPQETQDKFDQQRQEDMAMQKEQMQAQAQAKQQPQKPTSDEQ